MSNFPGAVLPDPSVIGGIAQPPLVQLPDPVGLFDARARRFADLANESQLAPYLNFLAGLCALQRDIQADLPPVTPMAPEALARAREFAMPPLDRSNFTADTAFESTFDHLLAAAKGIPMPEAASAALDRVLKSDRAARDEMVGNVLADSLPMEALAEHVFVSAALQVHFARRAAQLDAKALVPVADGACPCCGGPPVSSLVVEWPHAPGARYCGCALCGSLWNFVRIRCVSCGSSKGIGLEEIEGGTGAVKAETCEECHSYVKVLYQSKDPAADVVADDVASLALDLLMRDRPYRRAGFNPFLLGY